MKYKNKNITCCSGMNNKHMVYLVHHKLVISIRRTLPQFMDEGNNMK
jgi:hypothetical protein